MKPQMLMPQEIEVFYVIPSLRRALALAMKKTGKKQKEIAVLLGVEESTISQYIHEKRAAHLKFGKAVSIAVSESAKEIKDRISLIQQTQKLLKIVKNENALCQIHQKISNLPKSCKGCDI